MLLYNYHEKSVTSLALYLDLQALPNIVPVKFGCNMLTGDSSKYYNVHVHVHTSHTAVHTHAIHCVKIVMAIKGGGTGLRVSKFYCISLEFLPFLDTSLPSPFFSMYIQQYFGYRN